MAREMHFFFVLGVEFLLDRWEAAHKFSSSPRLILAGLVWRFPFSWDAHTVNAWNPGITSWGEGSLSHYVAGLKPPSQVVTAERFLPTVPPPPKKDQIWRKRQGYRNEQFLRAAARVAKRTIDQSLWTILAMVSVRWSNVGKNASFLDSREIESIWTCETIVKPWEFLGYFWSFFGGAYHPVSREIVFLLKNCISIGFINTAFLGSFKWMVWIWWELRLP